MTLSFQRHLDAFRNRLFIAFLFMVPISKASIEIAFAFILGLWIIDQFDSNRKTLWLSKQARSVFIAAVFYLLACLLSVPGSTNLSISISGFIRKTCQYWLFFIIAADFAQDTRLMKRAFWVIVFSAAVVCIDGIFQELTGTDFLRGHTISNFGRMTGPFENPNDLAIFLLMALPIAMGATLAMQRRKRQWLCGAVVVLLTICLIRTMYVIGLATLALEIFIFAYLHRPLRRYAWLFLFLCLGGGILMQAYHGVKLELLIDLKDSRGHATGLQDRLWMWGTGWAMFLDHFWTGAGINTFMDNYLNYRVGGEAMPRYAHNCYLQTAAETGIVGLSAFVGFLLACLNYWRNILKYLTQDFELRALCLGAATGAAGIMAQSFVDTSLYAIRHATLFWVLCGILTGIAYKARCAKEKQQNL